jgi:hypothetical protein
MFLLFFAGDTKRGHRACLQASRLYRLLTVHTSSEASFVHSGKGLVNFAEELALAIAEFKNKILVDFASGEVRFVREVIWRENELVF